MKRYAIVGTGSRAGMYIQAIALKYANIAQLVALCDISQTRMDWYNSQLEANNCLPCATYKAEKFSQMIAETKPHTVIICTIDSTHHTFIIQALELGCDVITEKPITTDIDKLKAIFDTINHTGCSLQLAFNYRYAPAFTHVRKLLSEGIIGKPLSVDFSWMLDTYHGADYFRRWHREEQNSGSLLIHKSTHHFDLVNWWLQAYPQEVMAMGDLLFYGATNAESRGESYSYSRYTGVAEAQKDPFALFLDQDPILKGLYLDAETETGYIRDQNVFAEKITIDDTMCVVVCYDNHVLMSYSLVAYSPWEGLRIAFTGTKGRLELDIREKTTVMGTLEDQMASASTDAFSKAELRLYPMFGEMSKIPVAEGEGGHGGADPLMLEQIFKPISNGADPYGRSASHIDGAASVLVGIAANLSIQTREAVVIDRLFSFRIS